MSSDRGSKLRGLSQIGFRDFSKQDVNVTKLNMLCINTAHGMSCIYGTSLVILFWDLMLDSGLIYSLSSIVSHRHFKMDFNVLNKGKTTESNVESYDK
ncbi:hypothetical protein AVEN_56807-1 [Araneus ventricosus]|uniref:Uncharacterized protein n=1 Tax=Araneus ventricosus TaxID=182803 RepID=A0A4Y2K8T2_ARAVE|nr:hypothetical protein AVEN_56807-1 [Araneus ventricosus]